MSKYQATGVDPPQAGAFVYEDDIGDPNQLVNVVYNKEL